MVHGVFMNNLRIVPDRPLNSLDEVTNLYAKEELRQFIQTIKTIVSEYSEKDSLVIGLEGSWGSGKSTILNLLSTDYEPKPIVFNPWYFTDTTNIISQFFRHIGITLRNNKEYIDIGLVFGDLADALATISATVTLVNPVMGQAISVSNVIFRFFAKKCKLKSKDLWGIKEELSIKLIENDKPIIVLIDDLDRLHKDEIACMLKAIRAIGSLPNVIYIVAYDREIVAAALGSDNVDGDEYLEKIIQLAMTVPKIYETDVHHYLMSELDRIGLLTSNSLDTYRLILVFLLDHVTTIRKAKQIINRLNYRISFQRGQLCDLDVFLLSVLEVIEPKVVDLIRRNPPIDSPEFPIAGRLLSSKQRKISFVHDVMRLLNLVPKDFSIDSKPQNVFESEDNNFMVGEPLRISASSLGHYRVIVYIIKLLFDFEGYPEFHDGIVARPDINIKDLKHRIREDQYFDYYFTFTDQRGCTMSQYTALINRLRSGERAFQVNELNPFKEAFIYKCVYEWVTEDFAEYLKLLSQVLSDSTYLNMEKPYQAIKQLLYKCLETHTLAESTIMSVTTPSTKVIYLVVMYRYLSRVIDPSDPKRIEILLNKHGKLILQQIADNTRSQKNELVDNVFPGDVVEFVKEYVADNDIDDAYAQLINSDKFITSIVKMYMVYDSKGSPTLEHKGIVNIIGYDVIRKRCHDISQTAEYKQLSQDLKQLIAACR